MEQLAGAVAEFERGHGTHRRLRREATVGNGARYRIKDFAAFYLARLIRFSLPTHTDPAERDAEIAKLIAALDARPAR